MTLADISVAEGELTDLIEDFNEGRIQFAFVRVKDPNSGLPKNILIAWCGGGVPERTKGYFTSHLAAVSKVLHGYHVQITARSDTDLEIDSIMQKVADASGAKYSAGGAGGAPAAAPPPVKTKPVFTPTSSGAANPLIAARSRKDENVDADGWGADAPPVTRTQIEKVDSSYKPTKVNINELRSQNSGTSGVSSSGPRDDGPSDVVKGGYQPIGKVDIAAIRAQAQKTGDDRPTPVKGAYEPVGKVDIAAIKARAQKPTESEEAEPTPKSVSERTAAFSQPAQSERLTSLPKPKVAKKFGGASAFMGTKAPTPGGLGFGGPAAPVAPPVGAASRTFADQGGKTPAQQWAERKARERGDSINEPSPAAPAAAAPAITAQKSGSEWKSGYTGKSWAVQQPSYSRGSDGGELSQQNTGEVQKTPEETPASPSGGVSAMRDRFKNTAPISAAATPPPPPPTQEPTSRGIEEPEAPPPVPDTSRPSGGFALPGLPSRPAPADEEEEPEDPTAYQPQEQEREPSPVRIAVPVSRGPEPPVERPEEQPTPPPVPVSEIAVPKEEELVDDHEAAGVARSAAGAVAEQSFEPEQVAAGQQGQGGHQAVAQYDYDKAEDNEIDLVEGQLVTNIEMVDEDWWMGTNHKGESGLFPSNYVEIVEGGSAQETPAPAAPAPAPAPPAEPTPAPAPAPVPAAAPTTAGPTATALYDYEAAEDNGM